MTSDCDVRAGRLGKLWIERPFLLVHGPTEDVAVWRHALCTIGDLHLLVAARSLFFQHEGMLFPGPEPAFLLAGHPWLTRARYSPGADTVNSAALAFNRLVLIMDEVSGAGVLETQESVCRTLLRMCLVSCCMHAAAHGICHGVLIEIVCVSLVCSRQARSLWKIHMTHSFGHMCRCCGCSRGLWSTAACLCACRRHCCCL